MNYQKFTREELVELLAIHTETFTRLLNEGGSGIEYEESKRIVNELVRQIKLMDKNCPKEPTPNNDDQPRGVNVNTSHIPNENLPATGNSID